MNHPPVISMFIGGIPSGYVKIANWKVTMLLMGKLTISMAIFNSYVTNYQRENSWVLLT